MLFHPIFRPRLRLQPLQPQPSRRRVYLLPLRTHQTLRSVMLSVFNGAQTNSALGTASSRTSSIPLTQSVSSVPPSNPARGTTSKVRPSTSCSKVGGKGFWDTHSRRCKRKSTATGDRKDDLRANHRSVLPLGRRRHRTHRPIQVPNI
jgi:hypothetical protein